MGGDGGQGALCSEAGTPWGLLMLHEAAGSLVPAEAEPPPLPASEHLDQVPL